MVSITASIVTSESIPFVTANEAHTLLETQLDRFLNLVKSLDPTDWSQSTACALWTVRDIVAHQAGGYASGAGYWEMARQYARIPKPGQLPEDAINDMQIRERARRSPEELIAELERVGPIAARNWAFGFRLVKAFAIPHAVAGTLSLRYLMWVIHSRDTWMHRLDICRATGREFYQTVDQDGRIVALILRDVERVLRSKLVGRAVVFDLSGITGGVWQMGAGAQAARIQMDALDFCIFASGRFTYSEAMDRAVITGDSKLVHTLLEKLLILF